MASEQSRNSAAPRQRAATVRRPCPNCGRSFNCIKPSENCWCLRVDRNFDYAAFFLKTGSMACVCPVCLTGKEEERGADDECAG